MQNNRFYQHRKEIDKLSKERHVTLDVASTMYAEEHGWKNWQAEMNAWKALVIKYEQAKINARNKGMDKNKDGEINAADLFAD